MVEGSDPMPEPTQLALDPHHTPPAVLTRQPHDQVYQFLADRRTTRRLGLGPLLRYEALVPAQQRTGRDDPTLTQPLRQDPSHRSEYGPVRPGQARFRVAPAQERHLMVQHQYLRVLGACDRASSASHDTPVTNTL
jgi:hypothetical protein